MLVMRWIVVWAVAMLVVVGCSEKRTKGSADSGGGGAKGGQGGIGAGGRGGEMLNPGTGGVTGIGGNAGANGEPGDEPVEPGYGWLSDPKVWYEVEFERPPRFARIYTGDPSGFEFPSVEWNSDCGDGCSSATFSFGDSTGDAVLSSLFVSADGSHEAHLAISHTFEGSGRLIRRLVRLADGSSLGAVNVSQGRRAGEEIVLGMRLESAGSLVVGKINDAGSSSVWAAFGSVVGWDVKRPWRDEPYYLAACFNFGLAVNPPVYFFGCPDGLHAMRERGSSSAIVFPESEGTAVGDGNHGVAVWAQHLFEEGRGSLSRIRLWSPQVDHIQTVVEVPGYVCGLAVGRDHIAGFRGEVPTGSNFCRTTLTGARFFWISRDGGEVREGQVLPAEAMLARGLSTTDTFTAAQTVLPTGRGIPHNERIHVTLIRHSDGKMRQFLMPAGYSMGNTTVALDDDYLYLTRWNSTPGDSSFDRVLRYRLDLFDEIGIPYPPEDD